MVDIDLAFSNRCHAYAYNVVFPFLIAVPLDSSSVVIARLQPVQQWHNFIFVVKIITFIKEKSKQDMVKIISLTSAIVWLYRTDRQCLQSDNHLGARFVSSPQYLQETMQWCMDMSIRRTEADRWGHKCVNGMNTMEPHVKDFSIRDSTFAPNMLNSYT